MICPQTAYAIPLVTTLLVFSLLVDDFPLKAEILIDL